MHFSLNRQAVASLFLASAVPLAAQTFNEASLAEDTRSALGNPESREAKTFENLLQPGTYEVPATKADARLAAPAAAFLSQDATLASRLPARQVSDESVVDASALKNPSPFRKIAVSANAAAADVNAANLTEGLALLSATYRTPGEAASAEDCPKVGLSIRQRVKSAPSDILAIVESEVSANPGCSCEIVKGALTAAGADAELTASVVEVASVAAPEFMRMISQCAIATVPESLANVQTVLAKLDPNSGESGSSAKSAKSSKSGKEGLSAAAKPVEEKGNPLDLPPLGPPLPPPPFNPPSITDVDLRSR